MLLTFSKPEFENLIIEGKKIHTIRVDKHHRWHSGRIIQFAFWSGKPYRSKIRRFFKEIPCVSVQRIFMTIDNDLEVTAGGNYLTPREIEKLALNDGFNSVDEFSDWFFPEGCKHTEWSGRIIHWTDLKY